MRRVKFIVSFLCVVLAVSFCLCLISCEKNETSGNFDELYEAISAYDEIISDKEDQQLQENKQEFIIVIPANCGAEIFDSAAFLSQTMSKYVGYDVKVYYDSDVQESSSYVEILVGETNREKSKRYIKELRSLDFGYKYDDGAVIISAHTESLVLSATCKFIEKIVSEEISTEYISTLSPLLVCEDYGIEKVTLNGFELSEYSIVYNKENDRNEYAIAKAFGDKLSQSTGYALPILSDDEVISSTRAICVGKSSVTLTDAPSGTFVVAVTDFQNIELLANDNYGMALVVEKFLQLIFESEIDRVCELTISGVTKTLYENEEISFYIVRDDYLSGSIESYRNTVFGVRESSLAVFDTLSSSVKSNIYNNLGSLSSLNDNFYYLNSEKMRCVESKCVEVDDGEIVTIVLENLKGERFAFVGGFCGAGSMARNSAVFGKRLSDECAAYADLPLLVIHELSQELDSEFASQNSRLETVLSGRGVYVSTDRFDFVGGERSEFADSLYADVIRLKLGSK